MEGSNNNQDESVATQSLNRIKSMIINCGWQHIRGCKWCGDVLMEWQGCDCSVCDIFICDSCNEKYESHKTPKDSGHAICRDCAYHCDEKGCDQVYYSNQEGKIIRCLECGHWWCKTHSEKHECIIK